MQTKGMPLWLPITLFNGARKATGKAAVMLDNVVSGRDIVDCKRRGLPDPPGVGDCLEAAERALSDALNCVRDLRKIAE